MEEIPNQHQLVTVAVAEAKHAGEESNVSGELGLLCEHGVNLCDGLKNGIPHKLFLIDFRCCCKRLLFNLSLQLLQANLN
jgi:hypothetical protein